MTKEDRLIEAGGKITRFNHVFEEAEPYIKKYWQALQKIWATKINENNFGNGNYKILKEYGLVEWRPNWGTSNGYVWDYRLRELSNFIYKY